MDESLRIDVALEVEAADSSIAIDFLLDNINLSKSRLKQTMNKGAVWLIREGQPKQRLRRAMTDLQVGDIVEVYYDEYLLAQVPQVTAPIADFELYSVWHKPAGMLTFGNDWGDHLSILRQAELYFNKARPCFILDHLDQDASGLVILSHHKRAAAALSELLVNDQIIKHYRAEVSGILGEVGSTGVFDQPLDGKPGLTEYRVHKVSDYANQSNVELITRTGRAQQVRRHLADAGHAIVGDEGEGMKLTLDQIEFTCPLTGEARLLTLN
ncbi:pseudouridine synthase family protein [Salinibius halmophilus]|uniref:pseudouridine synthase family protein n=1 Tax=Salinibius halmophilus TaxID=1853216 RepID=UPI000E675524|nr:RNA pseudouridine synthase [Salinibius halmophilus]